MKFHFQLGYSTGQDVRLGKVGLQRQYRIGSFVVSLFLSCFSCVEEENCVEEIMTGNVECSQK